MLELLAGPFDVVNEDDVILTFSSRCHYEDSIGLISSGLIEPLNQGYRVTQLDGLTFKRGESAFGNFGHGKLVFDLETLDNWLTVKTLASNSLHPFNLPLGIADDAIVTEATNTFAPTSARTADRYLQFFGNSVLYTPIATPTVAYISEATLVGASGGGTPFLSRTRRENVICLSYLGGQIIYYDWVTKEQIDGAAFLPPNDGAWYSPRHDIFVALIDDQIAVYASTVLPTSISVPAATPSLLKGRHSVISTTLLGSNSDPAVGETVDWTLDGPGELLAESSVTDSDGEVIYIAPLNLSVDPTITATVRF